MGENVLDQRYPFGEHRRAGGSGLRYMIAHGSTRRVGEADRAMG